MSSTSPLRRGDLAPTPLDQIATWLAEGRAEGEDAAASMVLATIDDSGSPALRTVPLRAVSELGLVLHTDLGSGKGHDLLARPASVSALLVWRRQRRQVRVDAHAEVLPADASDAAFAQRDRQAQLRAWAASDRRPIRDRAELEAQVDEAMAAHAGDHPVARPATWAAVVLVPRRVEVWQAELGGPAHDRFLYERPPRGSTWEARRLRP